MKYVALLSGGKDSCFNLLHCHINGHELVASATLRAPEGIEELDSFMYQTVGQEAVHLVAQALDVPLYRGVIRGKAIAKELEYCPVAVSDGDDANRDETEDLFDLLRVVKGHHPHIEAVAVGAILSNYQRLRVENVCSRLGLIPLCYLWQRSQRELLAEMVDNGIDAVIIKVAGIGLTSKHVGKTLSQMQTHLLELNDLYGAHVCGEGGEYETLTLDSPIFRRKIRILDSEVVTHSDAGFASVYFLRIKNAILETKPVPDPQNVLSRLGCPSLLDKLGKAIVDIVSAHNLQNITPNLKLALPSTSPHASPVPTFSRKIGNWLCFANVQITSQVEHISFEDEAIGVFEKVKEQLSMHSMKWEDVVSVNLYLSSMDLFPQVNAIYGRYFSIAPPARACISTILRNGRRLRMEIVAYSPDGDLKTRRKSLHVQSLSYWAPANIGPYSQAFRCAQLIFISGQIGLVPAHNLLPVAPSFAMEAALSIQHIRRIQNYLRAELGSVYLPPILALITWITFDVDVSSMISLWQRLPAHQQDVSSFAEAASVFLVINELPKRARIECQALLHIPMIEIPDPDDHAFTLKATTSTSLSFKSGASWNLEMVYCAETYSNFYILMLNSQCNRLEIENILSEVLDSALSIRLHYTLNAQAQVLERLHHRLLSHAVTNVEVQGIFDRHGTEWDIAACIISTF